METNEKNKINGKEFNKILYKIARNQIKDALEDFQIYLKKYPNDICASLYYVNTLLKIGEIQQASELLKSEIFYNIILNEDLERFFYTKIYLFLCKEEYSECYSYITKNKNLFGKRKYDKEIILILKKKLGLIPKSDKLKDDYSLQQFINYSEELALSHIGQNHSINNISFYKFNHSFQIRNIYYKLREILPNKFKTADSLVIEKYIFKYDNCGIYNDNSVDYFIVYTIMNTNEILEMYPYENKENSPYIDLKYFKEGKKKNHKR